MMNYELDSPPADTCCPTSTCFLFLCYSCVLNSTSHLPSLKTPATAYWSCEPPLHSGATPSTTQVLMAVEKSFPLTAEGNFSFPFLQDRLSYIYCIFGLVFRIKFCFFLSTTFSLHHFPHLLLLLIPFASLSLGFTTYRSPHLLHLRLIDCIFTPSAA